MSAPHPSKREYDGPRFNQRDVMLAAALLRGPVHTTQVRQICFDLSNAARVFRFRHEFGLAIRTHIETERVGDRDIQRTAFYYIDNPETRLELKKLVQGE